MPPFAVNVAQNGRPVTVTNGGGDRDVQAGARAVRQPGGLSLGGPLARRLAMLGGAVRRPWTGSSSTT